MLDHLSIGIDDVDKAKSFYDKVLNTIDVKCLAEMDSLLAYGKDKIQFLAMLPHDGNPHTGGNGTHIAFVAKTEGQVDEFYNSALNNGGVCEGKPGERPYPHAKVYAAYIRDPFGNKLEVLTNGFSS